MVELSFNPRQCGALKKVSVIKVCQGTGKPVVKGVDGTVVRWLKIAHLYFTAPGYPASYMDVVR